MDCIKVANRNTKNAKHILYSSHFIDKIYAKTVWRSIQEDDTEKQGISYKSWKVHKVADTLFIEYICLFQEHLSCNKPQNYRGSPIWKQTLSDETPPLVKINPFET